ncbi:MAG: hypothetical protein WBA41_22400 [Rivularia sp. (in: cyanobacteria)]
MFKFLFDCSAFEISTTIQTVNNILFPVVWKAIIFIVMCEIFLVDIAVDGKLPMIDTQFIPGVVRTQIDENIPYKKDEPNVENLLSSMEEKIGDYKTEMELFDIDREQIYVRPGRTAS